MSDIKELKVKDINFTCGRISNRQAPFEGGCERKIEFTEAYRCSDCCVFFHRDCIRKHFDQKPIQDEIEEIEMWRPEVEDILKSNHPEKVELILGTVYGLIDKLVKRELIRRGVKLEKEHGKIPTETK